MWEKPLQALSGLRKRVHVQNSAVGVRQALRSAGRATVPGGTPGVRGQAGQLPSNGEVGRTGDRGLGRWARARLPRVLAVGVWSCFGGCWGAGFIGTGLILFVAESPGAVACCAGHIVGAQSVWTDGWRSRGCLRRGLGQCRRAPVGEGPAALSLPAPTVGREAAGGPGTMFVPW